MSYLFIFGINLYGFMVPISLSLQGFYSYKDKQTIDFNSLTKAGVFGIFGQPVRQICYY
jgi:hypothetical protein